MKKLKRILDPTTFPKDFKGENRKKKHLELMKERRAYLEAFAKNPDTAKFEIKSKWTPAKENLIAESMQKCCYCEAKFTTTSFGDVDHYRPKSKYWWLAYEYFNYLAACAICNRQFKKAIFDLKEGQLTEPDVVNQDDNQLLKLIEENYPDPVNKDKGIPIEKFIELLKVERAESIDPYLDDPQKYFKYEFNDETKEVFIMSRNTRIHSIANGAIKLVELNRKDLRADRYKVLFLYRTMRIISEATNIDSRIQKIVRYGLDQILKPNAEFAGMIQYFDNLSSEKILFKEDFQ